MPTGTALEYTSPENRGKCGFCGKEEGGYAKQDKNGKWQAACWDCIKPEPRPPQKREQVGTVIVEDLDINKAAPSKKAPGMAPSSHRPVVR